MSGAYADHAGCDVAHGQVMNGQDRRASRMARLFGRPETPGGPFVTIVHGAQSALRAQNIDFVGHGLVPGPWEGVRTRRTLGATLDHHLVVISASISSGTTKRSRLWFRPRAPLLHCRQARLCGARLFVVRPAIIETNSCRGGIISAVLGAGAAGLFISTNPMPSGAGQADRP
jgi:hypothetical protein